MRIFSSTTIRIGIACVLVVRCVLSIWPVDHAAAAGTSTTILYDAGYLNVKDFGAKGDGVTDDTAAINSAIRSRIRFYGYPMNLYFPAGTYLVSDVINAVNPDGTDNAHLTLQGESKDATKIKLKDNASGYNSAASTTKAVIRFAGEQGTQNQAFNNFLFDLTVDTGVLNPKAIGVNYIASNQGSIRNVSIVSQDGQGEIGLDITRQTGPALVKNVSVSGFKYGIKTGMPLYSMTLENITLSNQTVTGLYNENQVLAVRKLTSTNTVPAIINTNNNTMLSIIDSIFLGGASGISAIQNVNHASLFARSLDGSQSSYSSVITNYGTVVTGKTVTEFNSDYVQRLFQSTISSLQLPVQETPALPEDSPTDWADVEDYGANPNDTIDDTTAIQNAMNSGKSTIYFHPRNQTSNTYIISSPITVSGNVKRIAGFGTFIKPTGGTPVKFVINDTNYPQLFIDRLFGQIQLSHVSTKDLVLLDDQIASYANTSGSGNLYLEDTYAYTFAFNGNKAWLRQVNPESPNSTQIVNNGGTVWALGVKTEWMHTVAKTMVGGKSELLGVFMYPAQGNVPVSTPAFETVDSQASIGYGIFNDAVKSYTILFRETRGGVTSDLLADPLVPKRTSAGTKVSLYTAIPLSGDIPFGDTSPPSTPTLTLQSKTGTSATLTWGASSDNVGVTGYMVYRGNLRVADTSSLTFTDTGLDSQTTYTYTVKAHDYLFNLSNSSNLVIKTP
ncbi:glycosyl hydrolase family 28-related protein [Paenibacillus roseipurpureus]|uniref:Glycosyl hydrolase family 28-related protein n=1 Tax=Paenibacillus roseopurpureus TaxID=2918901 RepID=A0AA96LVR4_9BACL|nr:glycosyl hydrolase family 28-related protein [Paenibacillus sp. MBLB1832]WNR45550.1 glycosyl hydrolase family 28-related protein [Paenibacillus sp. MBLB1832]